MMVTQEQVRQIGEVDAVCAQIAPFLAGRDPGFQGAVLMTLLATWLAGHPEEVRSELLALHIKATRMMTTVQAALMRTEGRLDA